MEPVRDLQFTDDRLVAIYDTLNAGDPPRRCSPTLAGGTGRIAAHVDDELISRSTLRFMPRSEIAERLGGAGFTKVEWYGGWGGEPYDEETSPEIIAR
jgi:hypothetical protein